MDITKLSETELKALAFDILVIAEKNQANLNALNAELKKRADTNTATPIDKKD